MGFGSQRDFNRFMGDYISRLPRTQETSRPAPIPQKPRPMPMDKAEVLVEKELDKVEELSDDEGFFQKVKVFFWGRKPLEEDLKEVSDVDDYVDEVIPPKTAPRPIQRVGSMPSQVSRQDFRGMTASPARRMETMPIRRPEPSQMPLNKRFEYNPDGEKDLKYLTSLIESLIGKITYPERDKFLKSSEYRIYQDIKMRHR